jgi:hypothetical protein
MGPAQFQKLRLPPTAFSHRDFQFPGGFTKITHVASSLDFRGSFGDFRSEKLLPPAVFGCSSERRFPPNHFLNMKFLIPLLSAIGLWTPLTGKAGEPSAPVEKGEQPESPPKSKPQPPQVKMWFIQYHRDPGVYGDPDPNRVPESEAQIDAREWLQRVAEIHFAPGEEAFFNLRFRVLMVRASPATIALIDHFAHTAWKLDTVRPAIRMEATLVEFSVPKTTAIGAKPSIESLRKAAGDSWRVLNRIQVITNGNANKGIVTSKNVTPGTPLVAPPAGKDPSSSADSPPSFLPGEFGAILEAEPSLGAYSKEIIDLLISYQFRAPGPPLLNWTTITSVTVRDGVPMLLKLDSVAPEADRSHPAKLRALIMKVDLVPFGELTPHPENNLTAPTDPMHRN